MRFIPLLCFFVLLSFPAAAQQKMPAVPALEVVKEALKEIIPPKPVYALPEKVIVGGHINDILEMDLQSHSYRLDLYVWFRWRNPAYRPWETAEFMNAFDPADHVRTPVYDAPQEMPDGSLYMVIRQQGKFSAKFPLQKFPFDRQQLVVSMEDSVHDTAELVYVADAREAAPVSMSPDVRLPGFDVAAPALRIYNFAYPTLFGDASVEHPSAYSRADFVVAVARPWLATGVKIFLPVALIVFCTALVFFVHPSFIEGRLGVAITALLTLVALQLTTASGLPEADYLLMTDKVYLLCYLFVIATLMQVARTSAAVQAGRFDAVRKSDRRMLFALLALLLLGAGGIVLLTA